MAIKPVPITVIAEEKLKAFDCGDSSYSTMSFFLRDEALNLHRDGTAFTQVYTDSDNNDAIVGYERLCCWRKGSNSIFYQQTKTVTFL